MEDFIIAIETVANFNGEKIQEAENFIIKMKEKQKGGRERGRGKGRGRESKSTKR